ncbi:MAG: BlaI/MecI/CopY family transcriptional regulator [Planctomycetaceae bacterium]|jgi:predicted transcriptional regulator|nr:MAG: BlaI/MecI/CopY family transcriptional regulator [Planctomycetaceae bacterium]
MPRTPQDITDAELSVLQLLWERGRETIRRLTDTLYPNGTGVHYATVQKLLERLESKQYVRRDRSAWPHVFESLVGRDDLISRRLQMTADKLCDGSLAPLLTSLVRSTPLSTREVQSLREWLDALDQGSTDSR